MVLIGQITDMHLGENRCIGDGEVDPAARLKRAVAHLNGLDPRPDFVIATGDLTADGRPSEYVTLAEVLSALAMPYTLIPGNHDDRDNLRAAFPSLTWDDDGFLHHCLDWGPLRLIALDTLVPGRGGGELGEARLAWLESRLDESGDRPVLLAMHHPPVAVGIPAFDSMNCRDGAALGRLLERFGNVEAVICGHLHRAVSLRWAGTVLHSTPSTSYQYALTMKAGEALKAVDETPCCRLLAWLPESGLVSHLSPIA